ncbi:MAG: hypothetical protein ABEJ81_09250 [Haloferacaceae archaeon]
MDTSREWLTLDDGEEVVWSGQPRMRRILPQVGKSLAWLVVFVVVAVVGPRFAPAGIPPSPSPASHSCWPRCPPGRPSGRTW